ncbi:MAG: hypothetical protein WAM60_11345, partial [Candidatus Promineifilaceae bacterium]
VQCHSDRVSPLSSIQLIDQGGIFQVSTANMPSTPLKFLAAGLPEAAQIQLGPKFNTKTSQKSSLKIRTNEL